MSLCSICLFFHIFKNYFKLDLIWHAVSFWITIVHILLMNISVFSMRHIYLCHCSQRPFYGEGSTDVRAESSHLPRQPYEHCEPAGGLHSWRWGGRGGGRSVTDSTLAVSMTALNWSAARVHPHEAAAHIDVFDLVMINRIYPFFLFFFPYCDETIMRSSYLWIWTFESMSAESFSWLVLTMLESVSFIVIRLQNLVSELFLFFFISLFLARPNFSDHGILLLWRPA